MAPANCLSCGATFYRRAHNVRVCRGCCSAYWEGQRLAQYAVKRARSAGLLPPPSASPCTDCGGTATDYDHRDYGRPLDVQPVCRRCNVRRGPAIPRLDARAAAGA